MESLVEEERKKHFQQYEEIQLLKNENHELIRASRKQSEAIGEESATKGIPRGSFQKLEFYSSTAQVTMPKKPSPSIPNYTAELTAGKGYSRESQHLEEQIRDIASQLDQLGPKKKQR